MQDLSKVWFTEIVVVDNEVVSEYKLWHAEHAYKVLASKVASSLLEKRKDLFEEEPTAFDATIYKLRAYVLSSRQLHELVKEEAKIMLEAGWKPKEA